MSQSKSAEWLIKAHQDIAQRFNVPPEHREIGRTEVTRIVQALHGLDSMHLLAAGGTTDDVKGFYTNLLVASCRAAAMEIAMHARMIRHQPHPSCPDAATDIVTDFNRTQREPRPNRGSP